MEQETLDRESLCLNYEGQWELMALEQVEVILPCPDMIEVPGAPEKIVGMIYHAGGLIPVFKEDGSLYGMAADEVTGGGAIDTVYE